MEIVHLMAIKGLENDRHKLVIDEECTPKNKKNT